MIVDMISSLGRSVIKFFRALGRSGFMLFGALVGKPQIRKHFPLLVKQFIRIRCTVVINYPAFRFIYWNGVRLTRLCSLGRFFC